MRQDYPTAAILARAGYLCVTRHLTEHLTAICGVIEFCVLGAVSVNKA